MSFVIGRWSFAKRIKLIMKTKTIEVCAEFFLQLLSAGHHAGGYTVVKDGIPDDAKVLNAEVSSPGRISLLIESESFADVHPGALVPVLVPVVERCTLCALNEPIFFKDHADLLGWLKNRGAK
jgi:hypothetical protein